MQVESTALKTKRKTPIERVKIARHIDRPHGYDVLKEVASNFEVLHGDRAFGDDPAVVCGIGEIGNRKCLFIAQQKGRESRDKITCNYGMMSPHGYRKALRLMKLAEKFSLPVIAILDTPGANPSLDAEKNGQSRAIAQNLYEMFGIRTPIISLVLGEGCSGGALGIGICDKTLMLEHAYYSVISPEGCASILWKDSRKSNLAAKALKMQSEDLLAFGMIDKIISEKEGFHENQKGVYSEIKMELTLAIEELAKKSIPDLLVARAQKYRSF